jgi:hypothetical protein
VDANEIVYNCPAIEFICIERDGTVAVVQCKNHPNSRDYAREIDNRRTMAADFAKRIYATKTGNGVTPATAKLRDGLLGLNNSTLKFIVDDIAKLRDKDEALESTDIVDRIESLIRFTVPIDLDLYLDLSLTHSRCCIVLKQQQGWFEGTLEGEDFRKVAPRGDKRKRETEDEYVYPTGGDEDSEVDGSNRKNRKKTAAQ